MSSDTQPFDRNGAPPGAPDTLRSKSSATSLSGVEPTDAEAASADLIPEDLAISVRNVSKCYHIYSKPRDRLKQVVTRRFKTYYRPFWALSDVTFDVKRGDAVGIVGRNGCGKSTLLQIIAGTLTPTTGQVLLRGRIAALLELGSGFNPEFTGRDNVFLNAAILGIPRKEMEKRFEDIASFADIGEFMDQPVKHYSSGMHARLAFSVAISVDPDILILDEILAVGDMGFQQKCVARLRKLLDSGVTLLFVSHAPDAVKSLCRKGLFLEDGQVRHWGTAEEATDQYIGRLREVVNQHATQAQAELTAPAPTAAPDPAPTQQATRNSLRYGTGHARIEAVRLLDDAGNTIQLYVFGERITIEVLVRSHVDLTNLDVAFTVRDEAGVDLFGTSNADEQVDLGRLAKGEAKIVRFSFINNLRNGSYGVSMTLTRLPDRAGDLGATLDNVDACAAFQVTSINQRYVRQKFYTPVRVEVVSPGISVPTVEIAAGAPLASTPTGEA